jgi:hypothetical protein
MMSRSWNTSEQSIGEVQVSFKPILSGEKQSTFRPYERSGEEVSSPNYSSASNCRQVSNSRHTPKSDTSENLGVSQNGNVDRT